MASLHRVLVHLSDPRVSGSEASGDRTVPVENVENVENAENAVLAKAAEAVAVLVAASGAAKWSTS